MANLSEPVVLTCEAFGNPKPTITWYDTEDSIITEGNRDFNIAITESSVSFGFVVTVELVIIEVSTSFEGQYTCVAENGVANLINASGSLSTEVVTVLSKLL